jgi:hypothetical protein
VSPLSTHLPFTEALEHFHRHLAPGGTLVILGTSRAQGVSDHLLGTVAIPANLAMGRLKNKGSGASWSVAMTAPVREASMTFEEIARETCRVLPGARLRRRLFWRYTLVWRQP